MAKQSLQSIDDEQTGRKKWRVFWWCFCINVIAIFLLFLWPEPNSTPFVTMILRDLSLSGLFGVIILSVFLGFLLAELVGILIGLPVNVSPQATTLLGKETAHFIGALLLPIFYFFVLTLYYHSSVAKIIESQLRSVGL